MGNVLSHHHNVTETDMGNATSVKKSNTVTKENISNVHAELFKKTMVPVKPSAIFARIMDYPHLAHARHTERFGRLVVSCVLGGMIDPNSIEKF